MPIFRLCTEENFAAVPHSLLKCGELGLREKCLLAMMLSLPGNWEFSVEGLRTVFHLQESRDVLRTTLRKLEAAGYLKRERQIGRGGHIGWVWYVADRPSFTAPR